MHKKLICIGGNRKVEEFICVLYPLILAIHIISSYYSLHADFTCFFSYFTLLGLVLYSSYTIAFHINFKEFFSSLTNFSLCLVVHYWFLLFIQQFQWMPFIWLHLIAFFSHLVVVYSPHFYNSCKFKWMLITTQSQFYCTKYHHDNYVIFWNLSGPD